MCKTMKGSKGALSPNDSQPYLNQYRWITSNTAIVHTLLLYYIRVYIQSTLLHLARIIKFDRILCSGLCDE